MGGDRMFSPYLGCIQMAEIAVSQGLSPTPSVSPSISLSLPCSPPCAAQQSAVCLWDSVCQANLPAFQVGASK